MGRPKTIETGDLLAVARKVFREQGHTATTRDVAKAAGISQAVLYQRFKTKDDLFFAALTHDAPGLAGLNEIDPIGYEPQTYLAVFGARLKDHFRRVIPTLLTVAAHPKYGQEMMGQIHRHNRAGEVAAMIVLRVQTWQRAGKVRVMDVRAFSHTFIHTLHSMAMLDVLSGEPDRPTRPEELTGVIDIFWNGLKPVKAKAVSRKK